MCLGAVIFIAVFQKILLGVTSSADFCVKFAQDFLIGFLSSVILHSGKNYQST